MQYLDGGWAQLTAALRSMVEVQTGITVHAVDADAYNVAVDADAYNVAVDTDARTLTAHRVVLAAGTPKFARTLLDHPGWGDLGDRITAACLDASVRRVPSPGYVLSVDEPLYGTTQSPRHVKRHPAGPSSTPPANTRCELPDSSPAT